MYVHDGVRVKKRARDGEREREREEHINYHNSHPHPHTASSCPFSHSLLCSFCRVPAKRQPSKSPV